MLHALLEFFSHGLLNLSYWQIAIYTLAVTHITIIGVTVYLHRCQAHRALELHPIVSHFFPALVMANNGYGDGSVGRYSS